MAGAGIVPYVLCPAVASRCAAWLGDPDRARAAHELVAASVERGRFVDTLRISSAAGLAALEDRREEAIAGFREASTALRDLDATLDLGLTLLDYAVLIGPGDAGARAAAEEARAVFERLGCPPLLERLSVGLERWDSGTGTAPSEVADDVVRTGGSAAD
jgi:hypothetical protein